MLGHLLKKHCPRIGLSIFLGAYDLLRDFPGSWDVGAKADIVWTHAHCNTGMLEKFGIPSYKIKVCHRGIDLSLVKNDETERKPYRIISAGRIIRGKGFDFVIDAFKNIIDEWPEAELVLLGDGPDRFRLQEKVAELGLKRSVTFKGHVPHDQVFREFGMSNIFLFCSDNVTERLPNVVKEAMASGCICIVIPTPGIEELIEDKVTGFIVPKSANKITAVVRHVFENNAIQKAIQSKAKVLIAQEYDANIQILQQLQAWQYLVAKNDEYS